MESIESKFHRLNRIACQRCFYHPEILKKEASHFPEVAKKLQGQAKKEKQGLGNKETDHEVCFAAVLEDVGFEFLLKKKKNDHLSLLKTLADGCYYIYQVNGSQQSLDFQTLLVKDHEIKKTYTYDLKHTTTDQFYLNDGWFLDNIIYIVSWTSTENKCFVGLGQSIPSEAEKERFKKILDIKKQLNATTTTEADEEESSLIVYFRFANRYTCSKFTEDWSLERFTEVEKFLSAA